MICTVWNKSLPTYSTSHMLCNRTHQHLCAQEISLKLAAIPVFGHTKILHTLTGRVSAALVAAAFYPGKATQIPCKLQWSTMKYTHTHTHTLSLSLSHTHTHSLSLSHTHTHSLSLSHTHAHTHAYTLTHTCIHSHTHRHTHTHTHANSKTQRKATRSLLPTPHSQSLCN